MVLPQDVGISMPHLAMAFAISHPGITSALLGSRMEEQVDDLLAGIETVLSDDVLDRVDEIIPPGTDVGTLDQAYAPVSIQDTGTDAGPSASGALPEGRAPARREKHLHRQSLRRGRCAAP